MGDARACGNAAEPEMGRDARDEPAHQVPIRRAGDRKPDHQLPCSGHQPASAEAAGYGGGRIRCESGMIMTTTESPLARDLAQDGFSFRHGADTRRWLGDYGGLSDWDEFAASWDGMQRDLYMRDGGRYRRRRYAVFSSTRDAA